MNTFTHTSIRRVIAFIIVINAFATALYGIDYFIAADGDDANSGTNQAAPFRTLQKASDELSDGDSIWLKRGDTFRGYIRAFQDENITIGAYGSGEKPIIKGSVVITNWVPTTHPDLDSAHVFEADVSYTMLTNSGCPHLFVNDECMTIARYPNVDSPEDENWLNIDTGGNQTFTDAALTDYTPADDYWVGATIRYRRYSWESLRGIVSAYNDTEGRITATSSKENLLSFTSGWGYFLDNKLQELDYPGEWIYDEATGKVYLYPKNGINPNDALVEGLVEENGIIIFWKSHYATIQDIDVRQFIGNGIDMNNSSNPVVRRCNISHCDTAMYNYKGEEFIYEDNILNYNRNNGINISGATVGGSILCNTVMNTAVLRVYAITDSIIYGDALKIFGDDVVIRSNWVENTAYSAMEIIGSDNCILENNYIRNAQCVLNDGGSIIVRSENMLIKDNIILESYGDVGPSNGDNSEGSGKGHNSYGIGIFFMGPQPGCTIINNTIASCRDRGILTDETVDAVITNNTFFNNRVGILLKKNSENLRIHENKFLTAELHNRKRTHIGINYDTATNIFFDYNYFSSPYSGVIYLKDLGQYSLDFWQNRYPGYDTHSRQATNRFDKYEIVSVESENLITNGTFDIDDTGWTGTVFEPSHPEMDGGCARVDYSHGKTLLKQEIGFIPSNVWLHVQFDAVASGFFHLYAFLQDPPYWTFEHTDRDEHFVVNDTKQTYHLFLHTLRAMTNAAFYFGSRDWMGTATETNYWVDNIVVEHVQVAERNRAEIIVETAKAPAASADCVLIVNPYGTDKTYTLPSGLYDDIEGNPADSVMVKPYNSIILYRMRDIPEPAGILACILFSIAVIYKRQ